MKQKNDHISIEEKNECALQRRELTKIEAIKGSLRKEYKEEKKAKEKGYMMGEIKKNKK